MLFNDVLVMCPVTYLMTTMTLGTVSVCMTVLVLNIHHRGADTRIAPWLRRVVLVHIARLLSVRTSALDAAQGRRPPSTGRDDGCSLPTTTIMPGVLRRRPSQEQRQRGGGRQQIGNDDAQTLSCHYVPLDGVSNDVSATDPTNNDVGPPKLAPAGCEATRNGPTSLGLRVPSLAMSYGGRWRKQAHRMAHQRRWLFDATGRVVGDRLSRSGGDLGIGNFVGRSPPASPSRTMAVNDDDDDDRRLRVSTADDSDVMVNEWTELARVLDRSFFWLLFALMTMSALVILLYPKYTGNEDNWTIGG